MKTIALTTALLLALAACTEGERAPARTAAGSASLTNAPTSTPCPLGVGGAHVVVDDSDAGVVMTFTAGADRLTELRTRARDAAAMHSPGSRLGQGHNGHHATGGDHGLKPMQLPPSVATEEDIQGGARIWFAPSDPADIDTLREKIRERATAMMSACR